MRVGGEGSKVKGDGHDGDSQLAATTVRVSTF